ncbi:MAG: type II toxin-antitoxin system RelE/ParE family toxin [Candidatus Thermoplasmatota archaeon]|nr:type II toxin-antitoxin system RelE/ParE family toxin [Candidatus Thermoplasmatota archaeon]MCL6003021.1 type II toxin-antitoxin system RelE/ParE family toxin [Candidatus Thermoplasmatota archaeon]
MVVKIEEILYTSKFEHEVKKIKDRVVKIEIEKRIRKILLNPEIGKPLSYTLKGERTVRITPYRLIYTIDEKKVILLRLEHRKEVYK